MIKPQEEREGRNVESKYVVSQQPQWLEHVFSMIVAGDMELQFIPGRPNAKSSAAGNRGGKEHRLDRDHTSPWTLEIKAII